MVALSSGPTPSFPWPADGRPPELSLSAVVSIMMPTAAAATASSGGRSANDSPAPGLSAEPSTCWMMSPAQYKAAAPASHR